MAAWLRVGGSRRGSASVRRSPDSAGRRLRRRGAGDPPTRAAAGGAARGGRRSRGAGGRSPGSGWPGSRARRTVPAWPRCAARFATGSPCSRAVCAQHPREPALRWPRTLGHDAIPLARARPEDAVVADEMEARRRDEGGELLHQLARPEDDVVVPSASGASGGREASVLQSGEPLGRNGGTGDVAARRSRRFRSRAGTATFACRLTPPTLAQRSPCRTGSSASMRSPTRSIRRPARLPWRRGPRPRRRRAWRGVAVLGRGSSTRDRRSGCARALEQARDAPRHLARHALDLGVLGRGSGWKRSPPSASRA